MTRVVCFNPPMPVRFTRFRGLDGAEVSPPQELATLAAVARRDGHQAGVIDARALHLSIEESARRILRSAADLVIMSAETATVLPAAAVARALKDARAPVLIVLEGRHVSACPEETLGRYSQFDAGIVGEPEETLARLVAALEEGRGVAGLPGLAVRVAGRVEVAEGPPRLAELDQLPRPAWDLLPPLKRHYRPRTDCWIQWPALGLRTGRGCPSGCVFCDQSQFGRTVRSFSAGYVLEMLTELRDRYGIRHVHFDEDAFLVDRGRLDELVQGLRETRGRLTWGCRGRPDQIDPDWLGRARESGLRHVVLEIESGSQTILDRMGKKLRVEQAEEAIRAVRAAGLRATGIFMLGSFDESRETLQETLEFIRRTRPDGLVVNVFAPQPGSEAYVLAPRYGHFDPCWSRSDPRAAESFIPHGLEARRIQAARRRAYRSVYLRPGRLAARMGSLLLQPRVGLRRLGPDLSLLLYALGWPG